jgi:hypothetical protein
MCVLSALLLQRPAWPSLNFDFCHARRRAEWKGDGVGVGDLLSAAAKPEKEPRCPLNPDLGVSGSERESRTSSLLPAVSRSPGIDGLLQPSDPSGTAIWNCCPSGVLITTRRFI